jgi:hypothetical protein
MKYVLKAYFFSAFMRQHARPFVSVPSALRNERGAAVEDVAAASRTELALTLAWRTVRVRA